MLRTRLWMGTVLTLLALGVLLVDRWLAPWYPFLLLLVLILSLLGCYEFSTMLTPRQSPPRWLALAAVACLVFAPWPPHLWSWAQRLDPDPWHWVLGSLTAVLLVGFVEAMANYQNPESLPEGEAILVVVRIAFLLFMATYLGLLPAFLTQLRWPQVIRAGSADEQALVALTLTIFVPKCCDIGAYFTGRFLGKRRMTPLLSPKKTWEGLAGGILTAILVAVGVNRLGPALPGLLGSTDLCAIGFGITVGGMGVLGDLAESLIKRACRQKDASQVVPGFGGVLDVVDSIVYAAPVAYCWLC